MRNQALLTETRLLRLGVWENNDEVSRVAIRWDIVFELAQKVPHFLMLCSKSAINMADKQDPSLAGELASHYQLFLDNGYHGMGIYFKALQLFLEAFLDPNIHPAIRIQKAFCTKTLFVLWDRNSPSCEFVSKATFTDIKCAVDGLFLYLYMLMKQFPESPIVPQYLGSDINEMVFAFARIGMYSGRRTNMDALRLAQALEKRNSYTVISKDWKDEGVAHSRGRRILRNVTHKEEEDSGIYRGKDVHLSDMIKAMKQGAEDCIADGKDFKLGYLKLLDHSMYPRDYEEFEDDEIDVFDYYFGVENLEDYFHDVADCAGKEMVTTPMGTFDRRRVETYYIPQQGPFYYCR